MSSLKWSAIAVDDLQAIAEAIRVYNPSQEKLTVDNIIEKTGLLRQHPRIGLRRETDAYGTELRTFLASKRYRVLYEVSINEEVEILQVLDLRSDRSFYR